MTMRIRMLSLKHPHFPGQNWQIREGLCRPISLTLSDEAPLKVPLLLGQ